MTQLQHIVLSPRRTITWENPYNLSHLLSTNKQPYFNAFEVAELCVCGCVLTLFCVFPRKDRAGGRCVCAMGRWCLGRGWEFTNCPSCLTPVSPHCLLPPTQTEKKYRFRPNRLISPVLVYKSLGWLFSVGLWATPTVTPPLSHRDLLWVTHDQIWPQRFTFPVNTTGTHSTVGLCWFCPSSFASAPAILVLICLAFCHRDRFDASFCYVGPVDR